MNPLYEQTAEGGAPPATVTAVAPTSGGLTTHSDEFERAALLLPNKDTHVPLVDLQFGSTSTPVTYRMKLKRPEVQFPSDDDKTLSVRINMEALEQMTSTNEPGQPKPMTKGPGWVFRPFPFILVNAKGQNDMTVRELNRMLAAGGVVDRRADLSAGEVVAKLATLEGKEVAVKFSLRKGNERDENGNFKLFQRMSFAAVGEQQAATANGPGDY